MREIKFRAFEAAYKHKLEDRPAVMHYFNLNEYAFDQDGEQGAHHIDLENMPLMQYTGLKDKNGKEIYEEDVLKYEETTAGVHSESFFTVEWGEGGFYLKSSEDNEYNMEAHSSFTQGCEVLGNIYESPTAL